MVEIASRAYLGGDSFGPSKVDPGIHDIPHSASHSKNRISGTLVHDPRFPPALRSGSGGHYPWPIPALDCKIRG